MQRLIGEADHDLQHVAHPLIELLDQHALLGLGLGDLRDTSTNVTRTPSMVSLAAR